MKTITVLVVLWFVGGQSDTGAIFKPTEGKSCEELKKEALELTAKRGELISAKCTDIEVPEEPKVRRDPKTEKRS